MLLYTAQPKIDTKGHCYTLALQQMLTGVYIAQLCLIGLFSLRAATGPTVLLGILFILTIIFNVLTNRHFAPLEQYLPADLALDGSSDEEGEETPLLSSAEEGESAALQREESRIHRISNAVRVSPRLTGPLAQFFEPHIFASHSAMKQWLRDGDFDEDDVPEYSDDDIRKAYLNPAYTSQTPIIWLAKDDMGVSKNEVQENEKRELKCSEHGLTNKASCSGAWMISKRYLSSRRRSSGEYKACMASNQQPHDPGTYIYNACMTCHVGEPSSAK
jgi:hypothetical protein